MKYRQEDLLIDVGSTYFKVYAAGSAAQYFRDSHKDILEDLMGKCGKTVECFPAERIKICSSANSGLNAFVVSLTRSYSLKYASKIAYNSGVNIVGSVVLSEIVEHSPPVDVVDVVLIVGGIEGRRDVFRDGLPILLRKLQCRNVVYAGSSAEAHRVSDVVDDLVVLPNIIDERLQIVEGSLHGYLTNLYQKDIEGKEAVKRLRKITQGNIYSTPYIVSRSLTHAHKRFSVSEPFIVIDVGGATTDVHYSKDLARDNSGLSEAYGRFVFKSLGIYKSRPSLIFMAQQNEYVTELLAFLSVGERIYLDETGSATKSLMQLAIFLALFEMSFQKQACVTLDFLSVRSILVTGGVTQVLGRREVEKVVRFFYQKVMRSGRAPGIVFDTEYFLWTLGM